MKKGPAAIERHTVGFEIRDQGGKYLLQFRDALMRNPHLWSLFGGGIEPGEDPLAAGLREMREELELRLRPKDVVIGDTIMLGRKKTVTLMTVKQAMAWGDFNVREGAGAGFFRAEDIMKLDGTPTLELVRQRWKK